MSSNVQSFSPASSEMPTSDPLLSCQEGLSGTCRAAQCLIMNARCPRHWPRSRWLLLLGKHSSLSLDLARPRRASKQVRQRSWRTLLIVHWWHEFLPASCSRKCQGRATSGACDGSCGELEGGRAGPCERARRVVGRRFAACKKACEAGTAG